MQYEQVTGAPAVEALLRRIADGVSKGEVRIDDVVVVPLSTLEATVSVEDEEGQAEESGSAVVLRLGRFRHTGGPVAVERELSHPGD